MLEHGGAVRSVESNFETRNFYSLDGRTTTLDGLSITSTIEIVHQLKARDAFVGLINLINKYVQLAETRQPGDPLPAFSEDDLMSFGKMKGRNLPTNIKDLDYSKLHNSQVWCLADWMGVRSQVVTQTSEETRRSTLKEFITKNIEKAQQGYEVICLQKYGSPVESTVDKRALELASNVVNGHAQGIDQQAELSIRKHGSDLMNQLGPLAKKLVMEAADKTRPVLVKDSNGTRKVKGVLPPEFKRMVELASQRIPVLLVGPAGCGKTYLCEKLAEALDLEFSDQSCSEGMSESVFNGLLLPTGKNGAFEHVASPFMDRYECGGLMLLDEMDAGDPNLFTYINKAIANNSYTVPQRFTKPLIKKHKDFALVAAANTFGHGADAMYVGRNQLDAATLDRFKVGLIVLDYNQDVELSLANEDVCTWAWNIRKKIRDHKLRRIMSTRVIKDLGVMTEAYEWKKSDWETAYFAGWSDADRKLVTT